MLLFSVFPCEEDVTSCVDSRLVLPSVLGSPRPVSHMEISSCLWLSVMIHNRASRKEAGTPSHQLGFPNIAEVFPVLTWISLLSSGDPTPPSVASSLLFASICIKHHHGPDTWSSAGKTHRALVSLKPTLGWKRKSVRT